MTPITSTLLSLLSLTSTALVAASPIAVATESHRSSSSKVLPRAPGNETTGKIWKPTMYNIYPQSPDVAKPAVSGLYVETFEGKSQREQVAVFTGIPAGAKQCSLGWSQAGKDDRVFILKGDSGLTRIRQLSGLPSSSGGDDTSSSDAISFSSVQPYDDAPEEEGLGPDFTLWDDEQYDEWDHLGGQVDCAEEIYLRIALRDPATKASLYLGQDEQNGFWVEWTL